MKASKRIFQFTILIIIMFSVNIYSNPVAIHNINELLIDHQDSTNWKLEITVIDTGKYYLTSLTDTAYFKDSISVNYNEYIIITQDSLSSPFSINSLGDHITLYRSSDNRIDELIFGNVANSETPAPRPNQSISLIYVGYHHKFYFDNSPTLGNANDTLDASGFVNVYVTNQFGNSVENATVKYGIIWNHPGGVPNTDTTDSNGYFKFKDVSLLTKITVSKSDYESADTTILIEIDSTININLSITDTSSQSIDERFIAIAEEYDLNQNFPNPFNASTSFTFSIPKREYIEIAIFDVKGNKIQELFSGIHESGTYKIEWNSKFLSSGTYFYQLKTNNIIQSKKCVILK